MKIAIAGSTGLIGRHLCAHLKNHGHMIIPIDHKGDKLILNANHHDVDAVVNLSGVNIMQRWSAEFKGHAKDSRIGTASDINHFYDLQSKKPKVFISASAIGYYGNRPEETLIESSEKGEGFLSDLVAAWEKASFDSPIHRVVCFRLGMVLAPDGGALPPIVKMTRRWLGAIMGNPDKMTSWVHIEDVVRAFTKALEQSSYNGSYNLTSEQSVTQKKFMDTVAKELKRKIYLKLPSFIVKWIFGEASEILLDDAKVYPKKLKQSGFDFLYPDLDSALCSLVKQVP